MDEGAGVSETPTTLGPVSRLMRVLRKTAKPPATRTTINRIWILVLVDAFTGLGTYL
jgi:hypothetical protein